MCSQNFSFGAHLVCTEAPMNIAPAIVKNISEVPLARNSHPELQWRPVPTRFKWSLVSDERLLDTRICDLRILRHEAGHALDNAFRLHFKRRWIRTFGSFAQKYPPSYKPKPNSRRYVLNLDAWYAQAHPAEDFAETFAVWLQPRSNWRRRYRGWPALRKLEYIDELLDEIAGTRPRNRVRKKVETLPEIRLTLREHYDRKREKYAFEWPAYLDNDLRRIFSGESRHRNCETAASFLRRVAPEIQQLVSEGTGVHGYAIDHVMELMIERAAQLKLRAVGREEQLKRHLMIMLTVQTMNVVHSGYYRIAL